MNGKRNFQCSVSQYKLILSPYLQYRQFVDNKLSLLSTVETKIGCNSLHFNNIHIENSPVILMCTKCNVHIYRLQMWPLASQGGRPTAGQFAERASSYEEGLHSLPHHEQLERARLPTHHSDPFLATKVPWRQGMSPMYMNYANKPRLVPPLARDMGSRGYTPVQSGRGFPAFVKPGPNLVERRGNSQQYYLRSRAGPLGQINLVLTSYVMPIKFV